MMSNNMMPNNMMPNNMYFGPQQITDMMLNNVMAQQFGDILKDNFSFSFKTIVKFLLLMSLSEIKGSVSTIISTIAPFLKQFPMYVLPIYNELVNIIKTLRGKNLIEMQPEPSKQNHELYLTIDANFMMALYNYMCSFPKCKFNKSIIGVNISNLKEHFFLERITNIQFKNIIILNPIDYHVNMHTKDPVNVEISKILMVKSIESYTDLLNETQQKMVFATKSNFTSYYKMEDFLAAMKTQPTDTATEYDIAKLIVLNYPKLDIDQTSFIIGLICALCSIYDLMTTILNPLQTNKKLIFDINHNYNYNDLMNGKTKFVSVLSTKFRNSIIGYNANEIRNVFGNFAQGIADTKSEKTNQLQIEIPQDCPKNVDLVLEKFVDKVYKHQKKKSDNIKIYYLLLETEIESKEKPNPEYDSWLEKKKMFDEFKEVSKEVGMKNMLDITSFSIPPKMITTESTKQKISLKLLNETKKDIDTLYLRKADKEKLLTSLYQFKEKKDVLRNLGLPNKLNILLYGEPGTGKSTTIQAVATYLGKDIYYLDLKEATTNQDLQMMFEYVNKNVSNGGIIVIEDIDAMIDIVLKRKDSREYKVNDLVNNQNNKLSLEYLLNILQGTLTLDDSMLIVTTNHIDHLDPAFYRDGRFDVKIELKLCDHYQIQSIYQKFMDRSIPKEMMKQISENKYSPATFIFHVKDYIFNSETSDEDILGRFLAHELLI